MGKQSVKNRKNFYLLVVLSILLIILAGRAIPTARGPMCVNDEVGYWGNAAVLAGQDWLDTLSVNPYYAFGYSLLLVPLFWFGLPMQQMYQIALGYNVVFVLCSFYLAIHCARALFPRFTLNLCMLLGFACNAYASVLIQAHVAWPEPLLWLLYWNAFYQAIRLFSKPSVKGSLLLAFWCGIPILVHMRMVGVLVGAAVCVIAGLVLKRLNWRQAFAFFAVLLCFLVLMKVGEEYFRALVYSSSASSLTNTSSATSKAVLRRCFGSLEGFGQFLLSICGKLYYLGSATLLLGFFSIWYLFCQLWRAVLCAVKKISYTSMPWLFLLLTAGAMFALDAMAMSSQPTPGRLDQFVYGRYMEPAFGPLLLLGLALFVTGRIKWPGMAGGVGVLLALGTITNSVLNKAHVETEGAYPFGCLTIVSWERLFSEYFEKNKTFYGFIYLIFFVSAGGILISYGVRMAAKKLIAVRSPAHAKRRSAVLCTVLPLSVIVSFWAWASWAGCGFDFIRYAVRHPLMDDVHIATMRQVKAENVSDLTIDYVVESVGQTYDYYFYLLQPYYPYNAVHIVLLEDYLKEGPRKDTVYYSKIGAVKEELRKQNICLRESSIYDVYVRPDSPWAETVYRNAINIEELGLKDVDVAFYREHGVPVPVKPVDTQDDHWVKGIHFNLDQGLDPSMPLLFGPYISLPGYHYKVCFTVTVEDPGANQDSLLNLQVTSNNGQQCLARHQLDVTELTPGKEVNVWLDFGPNENLKTLENVEFVSRVSGDIKVSVKSIDLFCDAAASSIFG